MQVIPTCSCLKSPWGILMSTILFSISSNSCRSGNVVKASVMKKRKVELKIMILCFYFSLQETAPERIPRVSTLSPRGSWLSAALMCTTLSNRAKSSSLYCSRKLLVIHRNNTVHLIHTSPTPSTLVPRPQVKQVSVAITTYLL